MKAVITGRRKSQGADRADLKVVEVDQGGVLKINPLINWSFKQVKDYVDQEWVFSVFLFLQSRGCQYSLTTILSHGTISLLSPSHRNVPYNPLLDKGYRSIGDTHSTSPPTAEQLAAAASGQDVNERAGRWAGRAKTECGLHLNWDEMKKGAKEGKVEAGAEAGAGQTEGDAKQQVVLEEVVPIA